MSCIDIRGIVHTPLQQVLDPQLLKFTNVTSKKHGKLLFNAFYSGSRIHKTSKYYVTFACPTCGTVKDMLLSNLLHKLNKLKTPNANLKCSSCAPSCETTFSKKRLPSTSQELESVLPFTSIFEEIKNQPYSYDPSTRQVIVEENKHALQLDNCHAMCQACSAFFKMRTFHVHYVCHTPTILCQDCSSTMNMKRKCHANVTYKTAFELKFLKYCQKNGIHIQNGPCVSNMHTIAFFIPELNTYIDVKSNVVWNGLQKTNMLNVPLYLQDYVEDKLNGKYIVVYPKNFVEVTRSLLRLFLCVNSI